MNHPLNVMEKNKKPNLLFVFLIYLSWILFNEFTPYLNRIYDFRKIHIWILPAFRMTLMFLAAYLFVKFYERNSFSSGFNFRFKNIGKNAFWGFVFSVIAIAVGGSYLYLIVKPLTQKVLTASSGIPQEVGHTFWDRFFEYLYIIYEGIIEVLIFIGFFFDRLAKRWGHPLALIVSNVGFALWHYSYLQSGWLEGGLMIFMTFLLGSITTMNYIKTKNSLSPVICHTLIDSPYSIRILLGMM